MFWRTKDSIKNKCPVFSGYKQRSKVRLVYWECKLEQDNYGGCILKLKCQKSVERTYLDTGEQQTR